MTTRPERADGANVDLFPFLLEVERVVCHFLLGSVEVSGVVDEDVDGTTLVDHALGEIREPTQRNVGVYQALDAHDSRSVTSTPEYAVARPSTSSPPLRAVMITSAPHSAARLTISSPNDDTVQVIEGPHLTQAAIPARNDDALPAEVFA